MTMTYRIVQTDYDGENIYRLRGDLADGQIFISHPLPDLAELEDALRRHRLGIAPYDPTSAEPPATPKGWVPTSGRTFLRRAATKVDGSAQGCYNGVTGKVCRLRLKRVQTARHEVHYESLCHVNSIIN